MRVRVARNPHPAVLRKCPPGTDNGDSEARPAQGGVRGFFFCLPRPADLISAPFPRAPFRERNPADEFLPFHGWFRFVFRPLGSRSLPTGDRTNAKYCQPSETSQRGKCRRAI